MKRWDVDDDGVDVGFGAEDGVSPLVLDDTKPIKKDMVVNPSPPSSSIHRISIIHKLGLCPLQEASCIIVVSSNHRTASINAVEVIIDKLKARVPIWKNERYVRCIDGKGGGDGNDKEVISVQETESTRNDDTVRRSRERSVWKSNREWVVGGG